MRIGLAVVAAVVFGVAAPRSARAQACAEGRVATPRSSGYCCWPDQTWSEEHQRCEGPPSCPGTWVAEGDDCVAPPSCAEGRVPTEAPAGHCCWPAQRWSEEHQRCNGPPSCPPPRVAEGDQCVAPQVTPESVVGQAVPVPTTPARPDYGAFVGPRGPDHDPPPEPGVWPRSPWRPAGVEPPHPEEQLNGTLMGFGVAGLVLGYGAAVTAAAVAFQSNGVFIDHPLGVPDATCDDTVGALFLVPVLGPLFGVIATATCTVPRYRTFGGVAYRTSEGRGISDTGIFYVSGIASMIMQWAGFAMVLGAALGPETVQVFGTSDVAVSVTPHVLVGGAGITLALRSR